MRKLPGIVLALAFGSSAGASAAETAAGEFITDLDTWPANHASTIVELAGGEFLSCWFAGSAEAERDVRIVCSRFTEGRGWAFPTTAVAPGERSQGSLLANKFVGNPVLHLDDEGILWLFYEAVQIGGHSGAYVDYKISRDGGFTWSASRRLIGGFGDFGHLPRNKALSLGQGRFLLPVYREFTSKYGYTLLLTVQNGTIVSKSEARIPGAEHLQPSLIRDRDGRIRAYLRNSEGDRILTAVYDETRNAWSELRALALPNPNAAVDAITLSDGRILLAYNHSPSARTPLSLAISADGITFRHVADLESGSGAFAYPALILDRHGFVHVTYTWNKRAIKHVTFHENQL